MREAQTKPLRNGEGEPSPESGDQTQDRQGAEEETPPADQAERESAGQSAGEAAGESAGRSPDALAGAPPLQTPSDESAETGPDAEPLEPEEDTGVIVPLEQYQRLLAEFDNYRKRSDREQARTQQWARAALLEALLPVLDDFDRARAALGPKDRAFDRDGMLIILDRFAEILKGEGLTEVEASPGQAFDPEIHEAVLTVPTSKIAHGCVSEVLEKGYLCGERLLRAAKVVVARRPEDTESGADAGEP